MKKFMRLSLISVLLSAVLLSACGGKGNETDKTAEKKAGTPKIDLSMIEGEGERLDNILKAGVLTCATSPDYAPNEFQDISGGEVKYVGSDIELAKYIADQLGVELQIKPMDFEAVKAAVTTGQADIGISGLAYTEDRAESMELTEFFNNDIKSGQGLLVLKEKESELASAEDFNGKTVAAQNGTVQADLVKEQLSGAKLQAISSNNDALLMLKSGKADALALDIANAEMYLSAHSDLAISAFKFSYENQGNVAGIKKGETKFLNAVNLIIKDVNEKGLYTKWREEAIALAKSLGVEVEE